jgi:hypothetical protein
LDRAYGKPITAPDIAQIRQDLKRHLTEILGEGPQAMDKLRELKRCLDQLQEYDARDMIDAVAAPAGDGALP